MKKGVIKRGVCICVLILAVSLIPRYDQLAAKVESLKKSDTIVIDAGHGGRDAGASSSSGISEKAINLSIAEEVKKLAEAAGWQVVMTRETDISLGEDQIGAIRSKKTRDLKARREIIEKTQPVLAVSIHLNSFQSDTSVHGVQVFYPAGGGESGILEASKNLGEILQEQVRDGTKRVSLAKRDAFLFKQVTCPIVLIECGFLSNPKEASKLQTTEYQQKLAKGIFDGITKFTGKKPPKRIKVIENSDKKNR